MDLLADLQAGLLDDDRAAELRRRARTDPDVARRLGTLDRVRRDVADLGVDAASAPDVPVGVTARVGAALRHQPPPADAVRFAAAAAGLAAVIIAGVVGTAMLLRQEATGPGPPGVVPLSDGQLLALLTVPPDLGILANPQGRGSCLGGLGYPAGTSVLGARPFEVAGQPGVLLLLPGDTPKRVDAVVVAPNCSSVDTRLLARTVVTRP